MLPWSTLPEHGLTEFCYSKVDLVRDRKEMEKSLTELLALKTPRILLKEQIKIVDTGKRQPATVPMQPYFFQYHLAFIGALSQQWS